METIFTISIIRELRGSPITVLLAAIMLEQDGQIPITSQLLKTVTGYGDHPIADCIRLLTRPERQFLVRVNNGWRLASAQQLPLYLSTGAVDNYSDTRMENREKRGFLPSSSSSFNRNETTRLEEQEEEYIKNREKRGFLQNLELLKSLGVSEPKASQLARLHHVTPDYITAHFKAIEGTTFTIGTVIHRIEHQWRTDLLPAPKVSVDTDDGRRYISGKFSDFIER